MSRPTRVGEWCLFFGTRDTHATEEELSRLVHRLDDAFDIVNYILRTLAGCPSADAEETLRVARTSIDEALHELQTVLTQVRQHDPSVA